MVQKDCLMYDSIIIGCGFAGTVIGRELAENDKKVLYIQKGV